MRVRTVLALALAVGQSGCIRQVGPGPDLGQCAEIPDGVYTFGEAGIGTCLAGPADLSFFQQDGGTFLAVTNADPFRQFRGGGLLILDWDALAAELDDDPPARMYMHEVAVTAAVEILDDDDGDGKGDNAFLGGFGYFQDQQAAMVTSRLSETSNLRSGRDEAFVFDLTEMELGDGVRLAQTITLEDDPFPVVVEPATQRAYVGNLTDHSVSVLSSRSELADGDDLLSIIDVAPDAGASAGALVDVDGSGTFAALSALAVTEPADVVEDEWTLTYVDGTVRLYVPTAIDGADIDGLARYSSGDGRTFAASPIALESGLGEVREPFSEVDLEAGVPILWYARFGGTIHRARQDLGDDGTWTWIQDDQPVLAGGTFLGSPSVAPLDGTIGLYVDQRDEIGGDASVALATSADNIAYTLEGPVLVPPAGTSYEQPFVVLDPYAHRYRMWLTVRTDQGSDVALAESDDGRTWTEPVVVVAGDAAPVAAPTVTLLDGRYLMYHARDDGDRWTHVAAWSWDGRAWFSLGDAVDGAVEYDPTAPPRVAARTEILGAWRVEGVDTGPLSSLLPAGAPPLQLVGFELGVTSGHAEPNAVVSDDAAARGLIPGSAVATDDGSTLLYATVIGRGTRSQVVILEDDGDGLRQAVSASAFGAALGIGSGESVSDPVVARDDDGWVLFVTVDGADGPVVLQATSDDGLDWSQLGTQPALSGDAAEFDAAGQYVHAIETLDGGGYRLWYTGTDGATSRIGSATGDDLRGRFAREPGPLGAWRLGTGVPGSFDDTGVSHPMVVTIAGETHLYYTGFDGSSRHLGHAVIADDDTVVRRTDPTSDLSTAAMDGLARTFSAGGVESAVLAGVDAEGDLLLWYAGCDTQCAPGDGTRRLGVAGVPVATPDEVFAQQRFPTAGDLLSFSTSRGGPGAQVIELGQTTSQVQTLGYGMASLTLDPDRGFLYVTTKLDDVIFVLDVHDDTDADFADTNALDLEALVQIDTGNALAGFRDLVIVRSRGLGILAGRNPEQLVFVDLDRIPDDAVKETTTTTAVAVLPMLNAGQLAGDPEDAGVDTVADIGGGGMALTADEKLLLVPHFRGNGLSVYDLTLGAWGEEIAWLPNLGENPHMVAIAPDGRYAVVANYLGDVERQFASSTLAVIDLDPQSDRYLEAVTWLANR